MIEVPPNTPCYYTVKVGTKALHTIMSEFVELEEGLLDNGIVVSIDMSSDIEATNDVTKGMAKLESKLKVRDQHKKITFNPLYLPLAREKLVDAVEMDTDGNVTGVGDFQNPFETFNMQFEEDGKSTAWAKVVYHEFDIPHPLDPSTPYKTPYLQ